MTLVDFSLVAVAIASILFSVVLIMFIFYGAIFYKRLTKILDQLEVMAHTGLETSRTVHEFVDKTTQYSSNFVKNFITVRGATELFGYIGDAIKNARAKKEEKETTHESQPTSE